MQDRNPISIRRIDHVVIRANDLAGLSDFYVRVLGCRLEKGPGEGRLAQLRAGDSLRADAEKQVSRGDPFWPPRDTAFKEKVIGPGVSRFA